MGSNLFLQANLRDTQIVFSDQRIEKLDDFSVLPTSSSLRNKVVTHTISPTQLVSPEDMLKIIASYPKGEEGDRQILKENREIVYRLEPFLSKECPNIIVAGGVVIAIGKKHYNMSLVDLDDDVLRSSMSHELLF